MTITIDLLPEETTLLAAEASRQGLSLEEYVHHRLLINAETASPAERAARFRRWAQSHDRETPLLTDEAVSRAAMYEGDHD